MIPHHQYRLPKTRKDRSAKIFGDHDFNTHAHHKCSKSVQKKGGNISYQCKYFSVLSNCPLYSTSRPTIHSYSSYTRLFRYYFRFVYKYSLISYSLYIFIGGNGKVRN